MMLIRKILSETTAERQGKKRLMNSVRGFRAALGSGPMAPMGHFTMIIATRLGLSYSLSL